MTLIEELVEELRRRGISSPNVVLSGLMIPSGCPHLLAVVEACFPALVTLCDYHDDQDLLRARAVVLEIFLALRLNPALSDDSHPSIDSVPSEAANSVYRALAKRITNEQWWQTTLREALLTLMLLRPNAAGIERLSTALRWGLPVEHDLRERQRSPLVRIRLLIQYLKARDSATGASSAMTALNDVLTVLNGIPILRDEACHPNNDALIQSISSQGEGEAKSPGPREKLHRVARDIAVTAIALRREHHAPSDQVLMRVADVHEVLRRAEHWNERVRVALHGCLLLGRIAERVLKSCNEDMNLRIEHHLHEVWIQRCLPEDSRFAKVNLDGGYESVTHTLSLPLPRKLGADLLEIVRDQAGQSTLDELSRNLSQVRRETGHLVSLRRLTRWFEFSLENGPPDEALLVILGVVPNSSRDAAIHYFAPSAAGVIQRFQSAAQRLAEIFNVEVENGEWSRPPPPEAPYVGYSYRLKLDAVHALVTHLRALAELGRGRVSDERLRTAYNARVAKLTVMYLAATGARPNSVVVPLRDEVLSADGAVLVSEKDGLEYRSTRLVPLIDHVLSEFSAFTTWSIDKRLISAQIDRALPVAMIRDAQGNMLNPTLKVLREHVPGFDEHWPWPEDALRHLFRSRLWDQGCPTPWLRRVMGHYPRHAAADVHYAATPIWQGLHDWDLVIHEHLASLGF